MKAPYFSKVSARFSEQTQFGVVEPFGSGQIILRAAA
jgi:hypothetical protein